MTITAGSDLPRVSGRHRDKALARARKLKAIELKMSGLSYQQIADEMGYASRSTVYTIIKQAQTAHLSESVQEHRDLELARLDALQEPLWPLAMAGDPVAAQAVLKIIDARCRLLGVHEGRRKKTPEDRWENCQGPPTVIARVDDCRHEGCDKHGRF